jgi:hypothetical protein
MDENDDNDDKVIENWWENENDDDKVIENLWWRSDGWKVIGRKG